MNNYFEHNKQTIFTKWTLIVVAICLIVALAVFLIVLLPRPTATIANVYVEGKLVSTLHLDQAFNPVATYSGVRVQVADGAVQTVTGERVVTLRGAGSRIVYPTLGLVVELR